MFTAVVLAILAVLSTLVGVWDKLNSKVRKTIILAGILLAITAISQIIQVAQKNEQLETIAKQQRVIEDANVLLKSDLGMIDEASGGATQGNTAYLVDDEEPSVFAFEYIEAENKYKPQRLEPFKIVDDRRCQERLDWEKECNDSKPITLTKKMIEDLEGAAMRNGKLYLTTTQSNSKNGDEERQRCAFIELALDKEVFKVTRATRKLRDAIRDTFRNGLPSMPEKRVEESVNEVGKLEVMQIEGLAIDENNMVYLGFRTPVVEKKALILRANIDQIFSQHPQFESFVLDLGHDGRNYGIVSMDYDPKSRQILILGNSSLRNTTFPPVVWKWEVKDPKNVQHPVAYNGDLFEVFEAPGSRPAKPEVVLIPKEDRIHLFFDAEGTGGQLSLIRKGTDLLRVRK